jgi:hypothetical protein
MKGNEMILTKEQLESFHEAARPMMAWMNEHLHPHHTVVIEHNRAELHEGCVNIIDNQYLKD